MSDTAATGFLAALQLADSFFPSGAFAHSQGLEGMVRRGWVRSAADVESLLRLQLTWAIAPADGVGLLEAWNAAAASDLPSILENDRHLAALKLPKELRTASTQTGRRVSAETAAYVSDATAAQYRSLILSGETPGSAAVVLGVTSQALGIPADMAFLGFCHSYAVSILGAASRLISLTHTESQGILHRLRPMIADLHTMAADRSWREMQSFSPLVDIASMGHEDDDLRMFAS